MSHLPKRILLATDGSEDAAAATQTAVDIANRSGAELHVMHAFEFIPPREYMSVALRLRPPSGFSRQGEKALADQVERVEAAGGMVAGVHLRTGSPVDQILYASEEIEAGLIVVGRRGLGGVRRLLMGSVSEGVVHNARCPVLVLRSSEGTWPPARIVMADDSSDDSNEAARMAAGIGNLFDAEGSLVQVYPRILKSSQASGALEAKLVEQALRQAEADLQERAAEVEQTLGRRPDVRLVVDEGAGGVDGIALTILETARSMGEPTLISVGSRGLGRIRRARVGSVSTKVVRAGEGPVLVYPHPRDR